jgi:3-oxoacyl-[acyl-carrier-protein] synthase-1
MSAVITSSNVLCAIGRGSEQAWASARAGIARIVNSGAMDRHFDPIQMGLVPEDALGQLTPDIGRLPLPTRARRMLRLATPALQGLAIDASAPMRLFLGAPRLTPAEAPWLRHFPQYLQTLSGLPIDSAHSVVIPQGRAAALLALEAAVNALQEDASSPVIVGGVDSFLDLRLLSALGDEGRVLGPRVMDGFIPGEGAAFLVVERSGAGIRIDAVANVDDPGPRYGSAPARGEGLAEALSVLRGRLPASTPPVGVTFAGFNGEGFEAKLWGVAQLRHRDFFAPGMALEHPADKYGDAGAATGAILSAIATVALRDTSRAGPALVWAASDYDPRACALLSVSP